MQVADHIRRAAQRFGDRPALRSATRTLSFNDFDAMTDQLANGLLGTGLRPGDRVAVLLPNAIETIVAYYALAKAGLVRVALNSRDTPAEHEFRAADSGALALITYGPTVAGIGTTYDMDAIARLSADASAERCYVQKSPGDPYRIAYTGGTTGRSKGVILTERTEAAELGYTLMDYLPGIEVGDVMLHAAPIIHGSGAFFLPHLVSGGCSVVLDTFEAGPFLEQLERTKAKRTFLVPTMIAMVLQEANVEDVDTSALKALCYAASPIPPSVAARAQEVFGPVLNQYYGQTEAPLCITMLAPDQHHRVGSAGRPFTMTAVRVVDPEGHEVPRGELGEVVARGEIVMPGYWNRPEETARTLRNGWLHTGDVGYLDDEDFLYLKDRQNDLIISGGYNVYPREIEDVLTSHPSVLSAVVVGIPDDKWGEVVAAAVTARGDVAEDDLLAYARERLAGYKSPRRLEIWTDMPTSNVGKPLRRSVRERMTETVQR